MTTPALPTVRRSRRKPLLYATAIVTVLLLAGIGAAIAFGGPKPIAPLASINAPFTKVDFSAVPRAQRYAARDGTQLAWLHYPAATAAAPATTTGAAPTARRIVLVHGSSARGRSMHVLAQALAQAGFDVAALDMRGHGDSGPRGQAAYIGQLEDDVQDFLHAVPHGGPNTLLGFSSGGGFVLRFAAGTRQDLFDRYVLLSPYLRHDAPTARAGADGWVSVGIPRIIGLRLANAAGLSAWNDLPVVRFALDEFARQMLTPAYSYTLATNFGPHDDYLADIRGLRGRVQIVAGREDELFYAERFAGVFAGAGKEVPVTLVPGVNHMGLTLDAGAAQAVVQACRL